MTTVYTFVRDWDWWGPHFATHRPYKKGERVAFGSSARSLPEGVEIIKRDRLDAAIAVGAVTEEGSEDGGQSDEGPRQAEQEAHEASGRGARRSRAATSEGGG
jgi:hypothetical protein